TRRTASRPRPPAPRPPIARAPRPRSAGWAKPSRARSNRRPDPTPRGRLLVPRDGVWDVRLLEPGDLVRPQLECLRGGGASDVSNLRRTAERRRHGGPGEEPRERDLRTRYASLGRDLVHS